MSIEQKQVDSYDFSQITIQIKNEWNGISEHFRKIPLDHFIA